MYAYIVYAVKYIVLFFLVVIEVWKRLVYFYVSTNQLNEQEDIYIYMHIYILSSLWESDEGLIGDNSFMI